MKFVPIRAGKQMANVTLKGIKKIYPYSGNDEKKTKKKKGDQQPEENKPNLLRTDKGVVAVQDFNLEIADKEFIVLVGPSGCGKSTTLRMIAGLEEISEGELYIGDRLVNDVAPKDRDIAMVFQNYALYPHMTVYENMAFALKLRKLPKKEIDQKVREAAAILDITEYLQRKPKALSGGQRQRVAIGRAIVREPQVFLMDEPLSNLDAKLRNQMRAEIIKLRQRIDTTFIYVTHDQTEAMTLGDRIVVMKDGFIQQIGTPQQVFDTPSNLFVAGFIGTPQMNFFDAKLQKAANGDYYVTVDGVDFGLAADKQQLLRDKGVEPQDITLGVRPEHIMLCAENAAESHIKATVDVSEMMGSSIHLHVNANGKDVVLVLATVDLPAEHRMGFHYGDAVNFAFGGNVMHLFGTDGKNLLY
jgi:multiple sugar transport system ATP-binding protein